ncbi:MAG: DHH family phosphoesterase [Clostridia bacterium]|nr:DHH family phosphoesterase [Clostridia bacterium]
MTDTPYATLSLSAFCKRLLAAERLLFLLHRRPDGDTVGSAAALIHIAKALGKEAYGLCADPVPERLSFLTRGLSVGTVKPEGDFTVVAVDVASPEQLGALSELSLPVSMMLDHHEVGVPFADNLIFADAAAAGEVVFAVAETLVKMGKLRAIPRAAKTALYAALSSDTGCFRYSNVTPRTLRCAASLLEDGDVDSADVNHRLFEMKSKKQLLAEAYAIEHTEATEDGKIAWVLITNAERVALGVEEEHLETVIDMVRSREGVEVALAVREQPDGTIRASMRSSGFDVASLAAHFGGGGHLRAAGCTVKADTPADALAALRAEICNRFYR